MIHCSENHHTDIHTYGTDAVALTWPRVPLLLSLLPTRLFEEAGSLYLFLK